MPSVPPYPSSANGHHMGVVGVAAAAAAAHQSAMSALTNGQAGQLNSSVSPHGHGGGGGGHNHGAVGGGVNAGSGNVQPLTNEDVGIREVWASNLEDEFKIIRSIVQHYPYIAMDTEFPGVVARPVGTFLSNTDYVYQIMRCNIHLLKIIQLGLTFMDAHGKTPSGWSTWQFNFKFNLNEDMYSQESIDLLTNSGIQFKKHEEEGIDTNEFAILLIGSGVVLCDNIHWLSFHSGYDFGYLLRLLTAQELPKKVEDFFSLLKIFFPRVYDLKYLMKSTKDLKGGLQEVAEQLELERKGPQHQAGSDSLLTGETFFKMREIFFEDNIEEMRYSGFIYGLKVVDRAMNGLPGVPHQPKNRGGGVDGGPLVISSNVDGDPKDNNNDGSSNGGGGGAAGNGNVSGMFYPNFQATIATVTASN